MLNECAAADFSPLVFIRLMGEQQLKTSGLKPRGGDILITKKPRMYMLSTRQF